MISYTFFCKDPTESNDVFPFPEKETKDKKKIKTDIGQHFVIKN